jgi:hypothetical protein
VLLGTAHLATPIDEITKEQIHHLDDPTGVVVCGVVACYSVTSFRKRGIGSAFSFGP